MASPLTVDLNCDLGESFGRYQLGQDEEMMGIITSVNVACGAHAGDPDVMAHTVSMAMDYGLAVGAHPGYPDLQGFGRRSFGLSTSEIWHTLWYQLGALEAFAWVGGFCLKHMKPHGALYNLASQDESVADAIVYAISTYDSGLILVGLAGSVLVQKGLKAGLSVANEGFPDRNYLPDGQLMPRSQYGAVITDPEDVARNALRLVNEGVVINGHSQKIDTLCLHGDNPAAVENAMAVRQALENEGVKLAPFSDTIVS